MKLAKPTLELEATEEDLKDAETEQDDEQGRNLQSNSKGKMNGIDFNDYRDLTMTQGSYILAAFAALIT